MTSRTLCVFVFPFISSLSRSNNLGPRSCQGDLANQNTFEGCDFLNRWIGEGAGTPFPNLTALKKKKKKSNETQMYRCNIKTMMTKIITWNNEIHHWKLKSKTVQKIVYFWCVGSSINVKQMTLTSVPESPVPPSPHCPVLLPLIRRPS